MSSLFDQASAKAKEDELIDSVFDYQVEFNGVTADQYVQEKRAMAKGFSTPLHWNTWHENPSGSLGTNSEVTEIFKKLGKGLDFFFGELFDTLGEDQKFKIHDSLLSQPAAEMGKSRSESETLCLVRDRSKSIEQNCTEYLNTVTNPVPLNDESILRSIVINSLELECHKLIKEADTAPDNQLTIRHKITCIQYCLKIKYLVKGFSYWDCAQIVCGAYFRKDITRMRQRKAGTASTFTGTVTTRTFEPESSETQGDGYGSDTTMNRSCQSTPGSSVCGKQT